MSEKTLGEKRVRTDFNVGNSSAVDDIKRKTAELINTVELLRIEGKDARLTAIAQTTYEEAVGS